MVTAAVKGKNSLLLGRKAMTNLKDGVLKTRHITFQTNSQIVKAMIFPIVKYGCAVGP